jgi:Tol biopolymer transport system component
MNDQPAFDRLVTDWLLADAPARAPQGLLSAALERVALVGQEHPFGGRGFDVWIGRSPRRHWAIVGVLLALLLFGAIAGAGAMLRRPAVPPTGVANGWIAVSANPSNVGGGEAGDIYLVSGGAAARRIIGSDGDGVAQACPMFSPDGRRLAYGEGRQALQPGDDPLRGRASVADRAVVVVALDDHGDASPPMVRVTPSAGPGQILCPEWSPGGARVAFRIGAELWVADAVSGKTTVFQVTEAPIGQQGFEWSRDGSRIAVAEPGRIRIVSLEGGTSTVIPVTGATPASLGWTAEDDRIVYLATDEPGDGRELHVVDVDSQADDRLTPDPTVPRLTFDPGFGAVVSITPDVAVAAVSPQGTRVAYAYHDIRCTGDSCTGDPEHLLTMDLDGSDVVEVPIPIDFGSPGLDWSPDGTRLLLGSIGGLVSIPVAPGSPAIIHSGGELNLEWSGSEITWQPVFP